MILLYGVAVPQFHPLARACGKIRLWTESTPDQDQQSATVVLILAWIFYAIALALLLPFDMSSREGPAIWWLLVGAPDAFLRLWRIRATLFFVPVCVMAPAIAAVAYFA